MAGTDDWAIEHVDGQQYDIVSLLNYDARDVTMRGPDVVGSRGSDGFGGERVGEWRAAFDVIEAGAQIQAYLAPSCS
jgi:hypothetical protein